MQVTTGSSRDEVDTNRLHINKTSGNHTEKLTTVLTVGGVTVEVEVRRLWGRGVNHANGFVSTKVTNVPVHCEALPV